MDNDLSITHWNKASEYLTGVTARDAVGRSLTEVFPELLGNRAEEIFTQVIRNRGPQSFLTEYSLGGAKAVVEIRTYPTRRGLSVFLEDITQRTQAEQHADQWRASATGYAADPNVKTPHLDRLAAESLNLRNAVSVLPVCTPHREALLTGRFPTPTGMFLNDAHLPDAELCLAEILGAAGYGTGYSASGISMATGANLTFPRSTARDGNTGRPPSAPRL